MLVYSQRKDLENLIRKWGKQEGVATSPANVIAWLQINGLLNEEKIIEFLAKHNVVVKPVTPSGVDWKDWLEFWD